MPHFSVHTSDESLFCFSHGLDGGARFEGVIPFVPLGLSLISLTPGIFSPLETFCIISWNWFDWGACNPLSICARTYPLFVGSFKKKKRESPINYVQIFRPLKTNLPGSWCGFHFQTRLRRSLWIHLDCNCRRAQKKGGKKRWLDTNTHTDIRTCIYT